MKLFFLETMRRNLAGLGAIQRAVAESDFDRAAGIAENSLGLGGIKIHDTLALHMPEEMRALEWSFTRQAASLPCH